MVTTGTVTEEKEGKIISLSITQTADLGNCIL
jgi:hypothetical protein